MEENIKFDNYTDLVDEFSFTKWKEELEEILDISKISHEQLQDKNKRPRIIKAHEKLESEERWTDGYHTLLLGYARSRFRAFESYLKIVVGLDEDYIQLILNQNDSHFITHEFSPGTYSNKEISEVVYTLGNHEGTI